MRDPMTRGAKIGPRIATLVSQAIVATHKALLGTKHKLAMAVFHAMSDEISSEVHDVIGPTLEKVLATGKLPPELQNHLAFLARTHGQLNALAGSTLAASSIFSSIAQIMNNGLAPGVRDVIRLSPQMALDPETLAVLCAKGISTIDESLGDVEGQGFNSGQFDGLVDMEQSYPGSADALDMRRRGLIDDDTLTLYLQRNGMPYSEIPKYKGLLAQPITPADAALAVLRNIITQDQANAVAAEWGLSVDDLNVLIGNTGEPPGLMQLLEAFRRKFIDQATLEDGIRQSRVRDEWIPVVEQLRYEPMSVADAVDAYVQNYLTDDEMTDIADQNGLTPGAIATLALTAGEPLSRTEMFDLYNRGLVSESDVVQAERESRLKNKYNDLALNLHIRLLEPRMLAEAVQYGSVTTEQAVANAQDYGYSKADSEVLVGLGTARQLQVYKNKVIASIETMYEDGAIDNPTATNALTGLGISSDGAAFILEAADMKRTSKQTEQVVSAVRSKFLAYHIDEATVTQLLTTAGVPNTQIQYLTANWNIEIQGNVRQLTEAQIVKAVKDQMIPATPADSATWLANQPAASRPDVAPLDGQTRLCMMGYIQGDADLLLQGA